MLHFLQKAHYSENMHGWFDAAPLAQRVCYS